MLFNPWTSHGIVEQMTEKEKKEEGRMKREEGEEKEEEKKEEKERGRRRGKLEEVWLEAKLRWLCNGVVGGGRKNRTETRRGRKGSSGVLEPYSVEKMETGEEEEEGKEEEEKKKKKKKRPGCHPNELETNPISRRERRKNFPEVARDGASPESMGFDGSAESLGNRFRGPISKKKERKGRK